MQRGEMALIDNYNVKLRYDCWVSITTLIDNRLLSKHKKRLKEIQKLVREKSYTKNKYIDQYIKGSEEWNRNQYILNKEAMFLFSNVFIKYVNGLLKFIGMDIKSEDSSLGETD